MQKIILNEKLTLAFESLGEKLRLIIFEVDEELVCRKETLTNLQHFLAEDHAHIFRGRLQLKKKDSVIEVLMKQKTVGLISSSTLKETLNILGN